MAPLARPRRHPTLYGVTNPLRALGLTACALALVACASASKLAHQSSVALAKGDLHTAYDRALRAIEKDPQNQSARNAYTAASQSVAADYHARVVALAATDTIAAANLALDARNFALQVSRHQTALDTDPGYERAERAILTGAARVHYQRGLDAMGSRQPKLAVTEFTAVQRYDATFGDVASRLQAARSAATMRVALLPFVDDIGVPGLSQEIADTLQRQISRRAASDFRYTQFVSADELERTMTVAQLRNMRRDDAIELGRRLNADWVVVGRFRGLRARNSDRTLATPLFHRVETRDDNGVVAVRWDESTMRIVTRQREVTVQFEFDVIDASDGSVLAHREESADAAARIAWTDFRPEEHYDRYALLPPDLRRTDPERAKKVDAQWRDNMGSWQLQELLHSAREQRDRARYATHYRGEFYQDTREHPVWLGELPGENELAFIALRDTWRAVHATLRDLDKKD